MDRWITQQHDAVRLWYYCWQMHN